MKLHSRILTLAFFVLLVSRSLAFAADDSFLDRPMPMNPFKIVSFMDWQQKMEQITGKKVVIPAGLAEYMAGHPEAATRFSGGIGEEHGPKMEQFTPRDFLNTSWLFAGLKGHYDPARDAVVFEYSWTTTDTRSPAALVKTLLENKCPPRPADWVKKPLDPWRTAFDALISKPENQCANFARLVAEKYELLGGGSPITNLFAGNILDSAGKPHLLILNVYSTGTFPGACYLNYCLFAQNGKIEEAGVLQGASLHIGPLTGPDVVKLNDEKDGLMYHHHATDLTFGVENSRLGLKEIYRNGNAADPNIFPNSDMLGKTLFSITPE